MITDLRILLVIHALEPLLVRELSNVLRKRSSDIILIHNHPNVDIRKDAISSERDMRTLNEHFRQAERDLGIFKLHRHIIDQQALVLQPNRQPAYVGMMGKPGLPKKHAKLFAKAR